MAGSPASGAHGYLFLTVGKISISDGMCGFGHRKVEDLPVSCCMYVRVPRVISEELLHFCVWRFEVVYETQSPQSSHMCVLVYG